MEDAVKLNILDTQKLSNILERFFFSFCSFHAHLFTYEEREKFINVLKISSTELEELLSIIKNILYQVKIIYKIYIKL